MLESMVKDLCWKLLIMKPEKQRIAIAEAHGIKLPIFWRKWRWLEVHIGNDLPDYLNDLNAMHEAVNSLRARGGSEWFDFQKQIMEICGSTMNCIQATAAQRAEAFLRTIGKWCDE